MALKFTPKEESELSNFDCLPDGVYPFTVLESSIQESKSAKNAGREMCKLKLCVHGPSYDRHVYDYFADWFSEWKLKHFCDVSGLSAQYQAGAVDPSNDSWQGRTGMVIIGTEESAQYGEKNVVTDYGDGKKKDKPAAVKAAKPSTAPFSQPAQDDSDVPF